MKCDDLCFFKQCALDNQRFNLCATFDRKDCEGYKVELLD